MQSLSANTPTVRTVANTFVFDDSLRLARDATSTVQFMDAMAAIELIEEAVLFIDPKSHRIDRVNAAAGRLALVAPDALVGKSLNEFITGFHTILDRIGVGAVAADFSAQFVSRRVSVSVRVRICQTTSPHASLIVVLRDLRPDRQLRRLARQPAHRDSLTRLPNRAICRAQLRVLLSLGLTHFAVCFIDLDRFKRINDQHGHHVGDRVLACVAQRLSTCLRSDDLLVRYGGDEFVAILRSPRSQAEAVNMARTMRSAVRMPIVSRRRILVVSATFGICWYHGGGSSADNLLRDADRALYRAKQKKVSRWSRTPAD